MTFFVVIVLVSLYAVPHISKAFSFKDLLPNFSVKTEAQVKEDSKVDNTTKDSAVNESKGYTDSKFSSVNSDVNGLENDVKSLESNISSLKNKVDNIDFNNSQVDTRNLVQNPMTEDLDANEHGIDDITFLNFEYPAEINGDLTFRNSVIFDDQTFFNFPAMFNDDITIMDDKFQIYTGQIVDDEMVVAIEMSSDDGLKVNGGNNMSSPGILSQMTSDNVSAVHGFTTGTHSHGLSVQTQGVYSNAIDAVALGEGSYAGRFSGNVRIENGKDGSKIKRKDIEDIPSWIWERAIEDFRLKK